MAKIKVAFFDIDGTLADNNMPSRLGIYPRIPASARQAIAKLKANGIVPILATGRNYDILQRFTHHLGIDSMVASNGTHLVYQGQELAATPMPKETIQRIINQLDNMNYEYLLETPQALYHKALSKPIANHLLQNIDVFTKHNIPADVVQVIYHDNGAGRLDLDMPEIISEKVSPNAYTVHLKSVSKATGISAILHKMGLTPEDAVAFGDEENDLAMFDLVKYPIAMGDASPALKAKAFYVTDTVENDGIWKACEKLGLFN